MDWSIYLIRVSCFACDEVKKFVVISILPGDASQGAVDIYKHKEGVAEGVPSLQEHKAFVHSLEYDGFVDMIVERIHPKADEPRVDAGGTVVYVPPGGD